MGRFGDSFSGNPHPDLSCVAACGTSERDGFIAEQRLFDSEVLFAQTQCTKVGITPTEVQILRNMAPYIFRTVRVISQPCN